MSAMETVFLPVTSTGDAKAELTSDATRAKLKLKCICEYVIDTGEKRDSLLVDEKLLAGTPHPAPGWTDALYHPEAIRVFFSSAWLANGHNSTAVANRSLTDRCHFGVDQPGFTVKYPIWTTKSL
jgi:hypothetical protein